MSINRRMNRFWYMVCSYSVVILSNKKEQTTDAFSILDKISESSRPDLLFTINHGDLTLTETSVELDQKSQTKREHIL